MKNDKTLREQVRDLLTKNEAHAGFDAAVKDMPAALRGKIPDGSEHSPWQILEHLRIAQWDIVEFARDPKHVSPEFPEGYWPASAVPPNDKAWQKSVDGFRADHKALVDLVMDESSDLLAKIPHGDGQTILRQALLAADHNAYHLGQLILLRKQLGAWE